MVDSEEEYDRRKGRDKFRRERNDYEHRGRDERRRDPWEHERSSRSRDVWSGRGRDNRADNYGREYDRGRRDNRGYSPRRDISPPHPKRMRRNWDDGGYPMYDIPPYGGGPMHNNGPPPNWGPGPEMGPPPGGPYGGGGPGQNSRIDPDYPTQPPMMTFKQFLGQQEDSISDQDAIKKYNEYKLEFQKQQISEFFLAHKEEEWFKSKYHPEECEKRQKEVISALKKRCNVFLELLDGTYFENISVDTEKHEMLVKLLDAAVIKMEGGTDFDLTVLDEPEDEVEGAKTRNNSEPHPVDKSPDEKTRKRKREDSREEKNPDQPLEITITGEQKELMRKAQEYTKKQQQQEQNEDEEKKGKKKKRQRDKTEYSYESEESESESGSESEPEPAPPGLENEPPPPGIDDTDEGEIKERKRRSSGKEGKKDDERDEDTKQEDSDDKQKNPRPRALHKTCSIFLRNLAPSITKQEVEAVCKRYPGFVRVALQDPQPERRFFRRGWVTFEKDVNIKDICWNLNNIRLRDCDLGATLNRELKQRVRPVSGLTAHKLVVRQDIRLAAKIIQNFDQKWKIWKEPEEEKKDDEKEEKDSYSFVSKNPVLMHITDYLVDEGNYEEEELLGESVEEGKKDADPEVSIDRDETLNKVLDKLILYLRIVHSIDYYSANEYPNEDEMPHRCGIIHARGVPPNSKITQADLDDWLKNFKEKVMPFTDPQDKLEDDDAKKLGKKDMDALYDRFMNLCPNSLLCIPFFPNCYPGGLAAMHEAPKQIQIFCEKVEKFVTANIQELAKDKWLCPLSGKKFKGPEFIRKHIFNKHGEKVEEVKKEVAFFNNYLLDRKRPQLPEHPGNKQNQNGPGQNQFNSPAGGFQGPPNPNMMGYNQPRPPMMGGYGGPPPSFGPSYGNRRDYREEPMRRYPSRNFRRYAGNQNNARRSDPRSVIEYRDLDAPEDLDIL